MQCLLLPDLFPDLPLENKHYAISCIKYFFCKLSLYINNSLFHERFSKKVHVQKQCNF